MLTTDNNVVTALPTAGKDINELLSKEWLLTNSRGGYASSTVAGCNTRRYHGLLIGSPIPLANRIVGLANCMEILTVKPAPASDSAEPARQNELIPHKADTQKSFNLATFEFNDKLTPQGYRYIRHFRRDYGVHFCYEFDGIGLTKSIYLARDADQVAVVYDFSNLNAVLSQQTNGTSAPKREIEFMVRPFVALRDFHALQKSHAPLCANRTRNGLSVRQDGTHGCALSLKCSPMSFDSDPQWWFNFVYRSDKERGQAYTEDLWSPGIFRCSLEHSSRIILWASLSSKEDDLESDQILPDIEKVQDDLADHVETIIQQAKKQARQLGNASKKAEYRTLCLAADQFVARRQTDHRGELPNQQHTNTEPKYRTTILAGFPWFADWGRDAFISLPGLLLNTGRFDEAKSVLTTFAGAADEGMIPNRFDDYSYTAYFNSIDASLWFVHAAFEYLSATNDSQTFTRDLLPTIRWITDAYEKGTRFDIHADTDGLITGGNIDSQLTWMDAKFEGVAFTPRYGKAVEINALWYNGLCRLAAFYRNRDLPTSQKFETLAQKVAGGFVHQFWNDRAGHLNDCVLPDGTVDASLRPNQILAVSLPFCPLSDNQAQSVVETIEKHLLTGYGLRTLPQWDNRYKGLYVGHQRDRDGAYHQGTVWAWLMGHFIEAYLKVNGPNRTTKKKCAELIAPLLDHLANQGCLGQVNEIFDGDSPHHPRGCIAQAWSIAELIRAWHMIHS